MFDKKQTLKIKGVAVCMLMFHHLFYTVNRFGPYNMRFSWFTQDQVVMIATGMRVCVWIFAFLSAYGLTKQYMALGENCGAAECGAFIKKRWFSLMKPYWLVFALVLAVFALCGKMPLELYQDSWVNLALGALGVSDYFGAPMPASAWWYMCFAQILLLSIPFIAQLCRKFGALTFAAAFLLIPYLGEGVNSNFGGAYVNYLFVVVLGVLFAQNGTMEKLGKRDARWYVRVLEAAVWAVAIVVCIRINIRYAGDDPRKYTKLFMSAAAVLICLLVYKYVSNRYVEKGLQFLGKYSGYMFMIHPFFYLYFPQYVYWSGNVVLTFLTLLIMSLAGAVLCDLAGRLLGKLFGWAGNRWQSSRIMMKE